MQIELRSFKIRKIVLISAPRASLLIFIFNFQQTFFLLFSLNKYESSVLSRIWLHCRENNRDCSVKFCKDFWWNKHFKLWHFMLLLEKWKNNFDAWKQINLVDFLQILNSLKGHTKLWKPNRNSLIFQKQINEL